LRKAGSSGKPIKTSAPAVDDIPIAFRDTPNPPPRKPAQKIWLIGGISGIVVLALAAGVGFALVETQSMANRESQTETATPPSNAAGSAGETGETTAPPENLLGHLPYKEAPKTELSPISSDGSIQLRKAAAQAFKEMQAAAAADGVYITPISGFRTVDDQKYLFFEVKAERGQVTSQRAEVSAPPGYSEHHTGYAVDVGDADVPATNLSQDFEKTPAFKWMNENAAHYSFEISFPKDNPQGVSYEPWHWRYVGDIDSLETFYKARGKK
jgi:D-alanyl-D-alanine carboxypeptidase